MHADKTSVNNIANNPCDGACCFKTLLVNHMYKKVVISSPKKDMHANLSGDHSNHVDNFGVLFVLMLCPLSILIMIISCFCRLIKMLCLLYATFL